MEKILKEQIQSELVKCATNPIYFIKKYVKIQNPSSPVSSFNLYPFQEDLINNIHDHKYLIALKARQMGCSTLVAAYALWMMIFKENTSVLVISIKTDVSKDIIRKVKFSFERLPSWIREFVNDIIINNKMSLSFGNGSEIACSSSAPDAGRSKSLSWMVMDESAFLENAESIWASSYNTLSNTVGGKAFVLSTPNGQAGWFYEMWMMSERKENDFHTIKLPWFLHPLRDQKWRDEQTKQLGKRISNQELDCDFTTSGQTLISPTKIKELEIGCIEPIEKRRRDDNLWKWEEYDEKSKYILNIDTALGTGFTGDNSAIQILKLPTTDNVIVQVCEYIENKISPKELGMIAVSLCEEYGDALLVVEKTGGLGVATLQSALDTGYQNIFYEADLLRFVDTRQNKISEKFENEDNYVRAGFSTTSNTRPLIINKLEDSIRRNLVKINSRRTVDELKTFVYNNKGKVCALQGKTDDSLMAMGIGLWVIDSYIRRLPQITHQYNLSGVYTG